jgi:3-hydroxyisobutyrate dehydrogenase-like beta-hydroxyacid dehydrogenase
MNIGVAGCGIVGSRMARNWQKAGHGVLGWNRTRAHAEGTGIPLADSPLDLARRSDVIMIVVADPPALDSVVAALAQTSLAGKVVLNASTVGPHDNQRADQAVRAAGGEFLETPFTGSKAGAEAAKLVFYVGGETRLLQRIEPLLLQIGQKCFHFGPVGSAADAKLIMNLMLANLMEAMVEGYGIARKAGLDMQTFLEAYKANAGYSVLADMKSASMLAGRFDTHFSLKHMDKDIRLALARAGELQAACPLTSRLKEVFSEGMAQGWGDEDFSVLFRLIERKSKP